MVKGSLCIQLIDIIVSSDAGVRDRALESAVTGMDTRRLLRECEALDRFRRTSTNLYERVRALFFLYAIHRFHLPLKEGVSTRGLIPFEGYNHLLSRRTALTSLGAGGIGLALAASAR